MNYTLTLVTDFAEGIATAGFTTNGTPPAKGDVLYYRKCKYTVTAVYRWFKETYFHEGCALTQDVVEVVAESDAVIARRSASVREPETKS